jgi:hypothetical protein
VTVTAWWEAENSTARGLLRMAGDHGGRDEFNQLLAFERVQSGHAGRQHVAGRHRATRLIAEFTAFEAEGS